MLRRTVRWLGVLCALAAVGGGFAAWRWYGRADELVRDAVTEAFAELAPHATVTLRGATFDWDETVTVTGLSVAPKAGGAAAASVPELRIMLDRDRFREAERVEVRALTLVRPTLTLVRRADGSWNLADLLPLNPPDPAPACPAWEIEDATVRLVFEGTPAGDGAAGRGPLAATVHGLNCTLLPDSRRSYRVRGTGGMSGAGGDAGGVKFDGAVDLDRGAWRLAGAVRGLELGGGLLADAALGSPEVQAGLLAAREKFEEAERKLAGEPPTRTFRGPYRVAALDDAGPLVTPPAPDARGPVRLTDFGLEGDLAAEFRLSAGSFAEVPEYDVTVTCRSGTLVNRFLPFPLTGVRGTATIADGEVRLKQASGRHGATRATAEGVFRPTPIGIEGAVTLSAEHVPVTADDRGRLPEALRKLHEILGPTGTVDVRTATLETAPSVEDGELRNRWELRDLDLTVTDGTARPEKFPYPVREVRGTATTDDAGILRLDFRGSVGGKPGVFRGWVRNPGKRCEFRGAARVLGVPLDRAFRDACPPPVREAIEHMAFTGTADGELTLHRPPGFDAPVRWALNGAVRDGAVRADCFPLPIDGLTGRVRFDSYEEVWRFEELRGTYGPATLAGTAAFNPAPSPGPNRAPGRLDLDVTAAGAPLTRAVRAALPEGPRAVWDSLAPTAGTADLRVSVAWAPHGPVKVNVPEFRVRGAALRPTAFPLALSDVGAAGSYRANRTDGGGTLLLSSFAASHRDQTPAGPVAVRTAGRGEVRHAANGDWELSLDDLAADGLVIGPDLRAALPDSLRTAAEELDVRGPIDLRVPSLQLRGVSDDPDATTAAWRAVAAVGGNTANLGLTVTLGPGTVTCEGQFDGAAATLGGVLDVAQAEMLDHTLTEVVVPYRLRGDALTLGSPDDPAGRRMTATAYGGAVRADGAANLAAGPAYRLAAELNGAKLGAYAARHMGGSRNLEGNVRGKVTLAGRGGDPRTLTGGGTVEIKPAALGELPVILRLFKAVRMNDPTMFDSAAAQFDFADETVAFRRVDLLGQAISFVGRGRAGRRGDLDLQFYSKPPTTWRIPLVNALSTGWIGVQVGGTIGQPNVVTFSPAVEGSLRAFLMPLSPLVRGPGPRRTAGGR